MSQYISETAVITQIIQCGGAMLCRGKMEMVVLFGIVKKVFDDVSYIMSQAQLPEQDYKMNELYKEHKAHEKLRSEYGVKTFIQCSFGRGRRGQLSLICLNIVLAKLFRRRVYYINGPEMLPAPLAAPDEAVCLLQLDQGGDAAAKARNTLIVHNLRLVVYIAKKFENTGIGVEDLVSIGTIGLIKAVNTFCPARNIKLATYASRCIENEILMYLRKSSGLKNEVSIDEPLNIDWDGNELLLSDVLGTENDVVHQGLEKDVEKGLLEDAISHLSNRERTIMEMRFGLHDGTERTQKEVADTLGISQSYISRLEKRIIMRLRKEIERVS